MATAPTPAAPSRPAAAPKRSASRAKEVRFIEEANKPFKIARKASWFIAAGLILVAISIHWL